MAETPLIDRVVAQLRDSFEEMRKSEYRPDCHRDSKCTVCTRIIEWHAKKLIHIILGREEDNG